MREGKRREIVPALCWSLQGCQRGWISWEGAEERAGSCLERTRDGSLCNNNICKQPRALTQHKGTEPVHVTARNRESPQDLLEFWNISYPDIPSLLAPMAAPDLLGLLLAVGTPALGSGQQLQPVPPRMMERNRTKLRTLPV